MDDIKYFSEHFCIVSIRCDNRIFQELVEGQRRDPEITPYGEESRTF